MKRRFSVVFAVFAALIMTISLVGCSGNNTVLCEHDWIAATCTQPEFCSKCGETRGEAAGHTYVYTTVDATCDDAGFKNGECSVCHDKTTVYLPQLSHQYVSAVEEGDCETDTVTTYTCELCKDAYSEVTKRHVGHDTANVKWTFKSQEQGDAQCEYLVTETAKCNTCNKDIERTYHKHVAKWTIDEIEYSTCKEAGAVYYVCACGDEKYAKTEVLPVTPAAHDWIASNKAGITHECDVCGATKSEVVISGHSATLTADQLTGENLAIKTEADVTLQPDTALVDKMAGGVNIAATPVSKDELPTVNQEIADKLENAPIYNFELKNNAGNAIDFDGGKMTITVPYELSDGEDPTTVAVLYIDANGDEHVVDAVYGNDSATFTVEHFSHYAVVRLTAAERCALLGHNYNVTNFAATCSEDGFTVKSCNRCGDFVREDGEKKLGHDYKATVVPATCTEKGYTLMTCSRTDCDDSYVTSYTAILAHDYADTVVSPTCTAKGYTIHTCKNCGHSYRDSYTDMIAHNFVGNECTVCHKKNDASADSNYYLNLVNSLGNVADGYYLEIQNARFEIKATYSGEDGKHEETSKGEIETYKLQVALDADGYLVGSGEGRMTFSSTSSEQEVGGTQKILLAFKNKNIYISINQTNIDEYGKTVYESNMVMSQDEASLDQIKAYVEAYYTDELEAAVSKLLNNQAENNPLNAILAKVYESVFDRTETESGYALTLNYEKIADVVEFVNEHNCQEVFDAVFGEGEFASLMKFVKELPEMKFSDFVSKLVSKAEVYGLSQSDIYSAINSIITKMSDGNEFDFAEFVENYNSYTVPEMAEFLSGGEMTAEEIGSMITQMAEAYEPMLTDKETSLVDFVCGMVAEDEMAELVAGIKEFALSTLDALLEVAEQAVQVVVNTDASGAFASASVAAKDFAFNLDIPETLAPSEMKIAVTAEITLNIAAGSGAISDNNNIVVAVDNARKSFVNIIKNDKGSPIETEWSTKYQLVQYKGEYLLVPVLEPNRYILNSGNLSDPREEVYNGTPCMAVDYRMWDSTYVLDLEGGDYSYSKSCSGWTENDVSAKYNRYTIYTLYLDSKGYQLLGYELNTEATMESCEESTYTKTIYTNATQGKIMLSTPHKYTQIEEKKPTMCGETGYKKYRCTVCGDIKITYTSLSHDFEFSYRLKDEKLGCAGGVLEVGTCTICNKEYTSEMGKVVFPDGSHCTFRMTYPIADAKCPNTHVVMYRCACGEYIEYIEVGGGCEFDRINEVYCEKGENGCEHGYRYHYITTYQCAVTACAYTYSREEIDTFPDENCMMTHSTVYTLQDGTKYSITRTEAQHSNVSTTRTTEGDLTVCTQYCEKCKQTVRVDKYDTYDRWVYYFDTIEKNGWEKVFEPDSCYCVRYNLDENGVRVGEPYNYGFDHKTTRDVEQKSSCTQAHQETWTCSVCHTVVDVTDYYYGHRFQYNPELEKVVCIDCGMTNSIYADGPVVLENLSEKLGGFKIGYTNYRDILGISFYADYDVDTGAGTPIDDIDYNQNPTGYRCGILTIDADAVSAWLEDHAESTFTVVFETQARYDYKDDYPDYLEISLTFTAEELAEILGIQAEA